MAQTQDPKAVAAEIGRSSLYKALAQSAGMNLMEKNYQQVLSDLKTREQFAGMAKEVADLPEGEKLAEVLSRFLLVILMQTRPEQQALIFWQLYTHLRSTGLIDAVKANIGSILDVAGRRIPPKEGA